MAGERYDVVVVGGGITGVSLMTWLTRAGLNAVLLERGRLASGATGHNAGFLIEGVSDNYHDAVLRYGRQRAREVWELTRENRRLLLDLLEGHDVELRQRGSWSLATTRDEGDALRSSAELQREDDLPVEWHAAPEVTGGGEHGGLLHPDDADIHSAAAVLGLASRLPEGRVREGVDVIDIDPDAAGVRVATSAGDLWADHVVTATNAYAHALVPEVAISPVRGQMLQSRPVDRVVADRPVYANRGYQYWRQRSDGRLQVGGWRDTAMETEVGFEARPTREVQHHLEAHLRHIAGEVEVERRWAGIMGFTADGLPLVGRVSKTANVWICGGYNGHGMAFATWCSRALIDELSGAGRIPEWLRADRAPSRSSGA